MGTTVESALPQESGVRTQIDVMSTTASGNIALREAKSSATAGLTPNQTAAHPEIGKTGTTVGGRENPGILEVQRFHKLQYKSLGHSAQAVQDAHNDPIRIKKQKGGSLCR
jgi:hypothetical protein